MKKNFFTLILTFLSLLLISGCTNNQQVNKINEGANNYQKQESKNSQNIQEYSSNQNDQNNSNCTIKGNISASGEKIYHLSGCRSYSKTKINTSYGEKWFCSEEEAISAGWRKAKNCY